MICSFCKNGLQHNRCPGGTYCDCQHRGAKMNEIENKNNVDEDAAELEDEKEDDEDWAEDEDDEDDEDDEEELEDES